MSIIEVEVTDWIAQFDSEELILELQHRVECGKLNSKNLQKLEELIIGYKETKKGENLEEEDLFQVIIPFSSTIFHSDCIIRNWSLRKFYEKG